MVNIMNKKFIIVNNELSAKKMIAAGFILLGKTGNNYTFVNQPPKHFNFDTINSKHYCYSNILSI